MKMPPQAAHLWSEHLPQRGTTTRPFSSFSAVSFFPFNALGFTTSSLIPLLCDTRAPVHMANSCMQPVSTFFCYARTGCTFCKGGPSFSGSGPRFLTAVPSTPEQTIKDQEVLRPCTVLLPPQVDLQPVLRAPLSPSGQSLGFHPL